MMYVYAIFAIWILLNMVLLAWLLDRWPHNVHAAFSFLATTRLPSLIDRTFSADADTRTVLKEIFRSATPRRPIPPTKWKRWLDCGRV